MSEQGNQRRTIDNNRRKLIARWQTNEGQTMRAQLLTTLQEYRSMPDDVATASISERGPSPQLDLQGINLSGENLDGVNLSGAKLQGANLARCSLQQANLADADLRDTLLRHTDLTDADLQGANLKGAIMENTILLGSKLTDAYITKSTILAGMTDLSSSFISQTDGSPWFADRWPHPKNQRSEE